MKKYSWTEFKTLCKNNFLTMLMEEKETYYILITSNGPLVYRCDLQKNEIPNSEQIDFETNFKNNCNKKVLRNDAFAEKTLPSGKKLFRRAWGIKSTLQSSGDTTIEFIVPYIWCKITTMEIVGLPKMMSVDLTVHADINGAFKTSLEGSLIQTGVPKYKLNQFGFDVNASKDFYKDHSEYDADLFQGMIIKIVIKGGDVNTPTVGVNLTLHEVV